MAKPSVPSSPAAGEDGVPRPAEASPAPQRRARRKPRTTREIERRSAPLIALFTDFGLAGPYTGQVKTVLQLTAPTIPVVDLFADAPACNPRAAAYLLAAYALWFPPRTVFLAVVDPGVGGDRAPVIVAAEERWYVGPDNGLFEMVKRRAVTPPREWEITWRPTLLSPSFHGRDLFAPVAARIALGETPPGTLRDPKAMSGNGWPDDLAEIVYVDHYGNAMTGLRAGALAPDARLSVGGATLRSARTFSSVPAGEAFWYENSTGLAEIAVNGGRASETLGLAVGTPVAVAGSID